MQCSANKGICQVQVDGYYIVNCACLVIGFLTFQSIVKPLCNRIQALPMSSWKLKQKQ